jgi:adenylate cyclase
VLSYVAINLSNTYLDLTAPILWAIAFFGIAKIYALATDRALQRWLAFGVSDGAAEHSVLIMPILVEASEALPDAQLKKLKRSIELASKTPNSIEILQGTQSGVWGLFGDMVLVNWVYADSKAEYAAAAQQDAQTISQQLPTFIANLGLPTNTITRYALHDGKLLSKQSNGLASQWRTLFAQAVIKLEHETKYEHSHEDLT